LVLVRQFLELDLLGANRMSPMKDDAHQRSAPIDRTPRRHLFVVSHMRSFSSVLCHILGSHPEIDGYAETHQSYYGRSDLHRLTTLVGEMTGAPVSGRYVLDKILNMRQHLEPSVLARRDVRILFLVRKGPDTIRSLVSIARAGGHKGPASQPPGALYYYAKRLRQIEGYAATHGRGALFLESERLVNETDHVLSGIARWLELSEPLSPNYRRFRLTGVRGFGDPSPIIMAGRLVTEPSERHGSRMPIELPAEVVRVAEASHARCRDALLRFTREA
jgi:hypothetical protein